MNDRPGSVCHVDLGDERAVRSLCDRPKERDFLGGRGANVAVLLDVLTADLDPLSPDAPQA